MTGIDVKEYTRYRASEVLPLYKAVGWSNYYEHPQMLEKAYAGSLCVLGAYDHDKLVGVIRAVGDGCSIVFIQDLLVSPEYQHRGIGTGLMKEMLARFPHAYQIELVTDDTEKTIAFYKSLGFTPFHEIGCCGFMKNGIL